MRLLIDANLSPRLVEALADLYPESEHVFDSGIERSDTQVWQYARDRGGRILTFTSEYSFLGIRRRLYWCDSVTAKQG